MTFIVRDPLLSLNERVKLRRDAITFCFFLSFEWLLTFSFLETTTNNQHIFVWCQKCVFLFGRVEGKNGFSPLMDFIQMTRETKNPKKRPKFTLNWRHIWVEFFFFGVLSSKSPWPPLNFPKGLCFNLLSCQLNYEPQKCVIHLKDLDVKRFFLPKRGRSWWSQWTGQKKNTPPKIMQGL